MQQSPLNVSHGVPRNFRHQQVVLMSASATHAEALSLTIFPTRIDAHWETEIRTVWNAGECASEEHELVYEISWISELGAWRRFLRSERKVKG